MCPVQGRLGWGMLTQVRTTTFAKQGAGGALSDAAQLGVEVLLELIESAPEGIAVVDADRWEFHWINAEAARLLDRPVAGIPGSPAAVFAELREQDTATVVQGVDVFECMATTVRTADRVFRAVRFRNVTAARQRERELRAFSGTSSSIAFAGPLTTVLDRLAEEVKHASAMFACTFLLTDGKIVVQQAGQSGPYPGVLDYAERLNACTALGAPLVSMQA